MKKFRILSTFFIAIILTSIIISPVSQVFAINDFYSENDILFYDPGAADVVSGCSSSSGTIAEKVWSYFIQKGLTAEQTAGIMGNMYQESSISPTDLFRRFNGIGISPSRYTCM